jgi:2'-5' RNA ligase
MTVPAPGTIPATESALLVPVPAAEAAVDGLRRKFDPASALGMPAHITVLYPFAPPASMSSSFTEELGAVLEGFEAFEFTLSDVGWFDDRVMYLAPNPRAPFVELTVEISKAFPDYPPYRGAFSEVVPHLTVGEGGWPTRMRRAARRLERVLPIAAEAHEVLLMAPDGVGHWGVHRAFPLGRARS